MSSALRLVLVLLMLAGFGVVYAGCASERVGGPQPEESALVVLGWRVSPGRSWVGALDTEADTLVGEIPDVGTARAIEIEVSPDGKYFATMDVGEGLHLFNAQTLAIVGQAPLQGMASLSFTPDASQILAIKAYGPNTVYSLPSLSIDTVLPGRYWLAVPSPRREEIVAITSTYNALAPNHGVARLSTNSWAVVDSFQLISPATGGPVFVEQAELTPDGNKLIVLAGADLFLFDLDSHACVFRTPLVSNRGFALSPDAQKIWVVQGPVSLNYGQVVILDAETGAPLGTIPIPDPRTHLDEPLPLGPLVFHPFRPKAYLSTGYPYPSVLIINTESHEVESLLQLGPLYDLAIAPR